MSWFEEQIKLRKTRDDRDLADAVEDIAASVSRKRSSSLGDGRKATKNALDEILRYNHIKTREIPAEIHDLEDQMDYLFRPHGIMRRPVKLEPGWYRDAAGPYLGFKKDGSVIALIPNAVSGYSWIDPETGEKVPVKAKNADLLEEDAIFFYKPFPNRKLDATALFTYMLNCIPVSSRVLLILSALLVSLVGML